MSATNEKVALRKTTENQAQERTLVGNKQEREEQAKILAEAWGLSRIESDEEEELHDDEEARDVTGKGGLGSAKTKLNENSLEHRLHVAREKKKRDAGIKTRELASWRDEDEEDTIVTKSNSAASKKKPRISRPFDQPASKESTHPMAKAAEAEAKS